jgi:thiamine-monophosphate kinase
MARTPDQHARVRESGLLRTIYERSALLREEYDHVLVGPGDDCAVIESRDALPTLLKVDQLIEGRHFVRGTPIDLIARKALARAISDIAAMGGSPSASLVAAQLPAEWTQAQAEELHEALLRWSLVFGCPLVGGDTATIGKGAGLSLAVTLVGSTHPTRGPVLRSGARVGDDVYITGSVGGSFLAEKTAEFPFAGGGRHLTFEPRVTEANWLAGNLEDRLHAMLDVSDGVGVDAARLARASGVSIEVDAGRVPYSSEVVGREQKTMLKALGDGEDYELLFAVAAGTPVPATIPGAKTSMTRIGRVHDSSDAACVIVLPSGARVSGDALGWEH